MDRFAEAPISRLLGFDVEPGDCDNTVVHLAIDSRLHNPMGRVHGGVLSALADAAMGIAFGRSLDPNQDFATIDLHVHFMRPIRGPKITATASMTQRGLRIGFAECEIRDNRERLVATATCSCTVLEKQMG
jgi:uncharacterized protein (TIGR00369 family)